MRKLIYSLLLILVIGIGTVAPMDRNRQRLIMPIDRVLNMPDSEILMHIFSHLDVKEILRKQRTCKAFNRAIVSPVFFINRLTLRDPKLLKCLFVLQRKKTEFSKNDYPIAVDKNEAKEIFVHQQAVAFLNALNRARSIGRMDVFEKFLEEFGDQAAKDMASAIERILRHAARVFDSEEWCFRESQDLKIIERYLEIIENCSEVPGIEKIRIDDFYKQSRSPEDIIELAIKHKCFLVVKYFSRER